LSKQANVIRREGRKKKKNIITLEGLENNGSGAQFDNFPGNRKGHRKKRLRIGVGRNDDVGAAARSRRAASWRRKAT